MADLVQRCDLADLFPSWYFDFFGFLLFLLFLFLLALLLLELYTQIRQLQLDHVVHHLLNLVLNFRQNCLLYLLDLWLVFRASLVLPFFGVLINLLLHDQYSLSRTASWILFLELVLFCEFLLFLTLTLLLLLCLSQLQHHLLFLRGRRNLHFIFLIEILDSVWNFRELISFHELTDPQSAISQHFFLQGFFPFLV